MPNNAIASSPASRVPAIVWLLQGARFGDNQQVLALGAALEARFGWQLKVKQLKFRRGPVPGPDVEQGLDILDVVASDSVRPAPGEPWPHVAIAVGRRAAPVARWIAAQGAPYAIHVQIGRFQDPFDTVDLLVTTAQYGLPGGPNVLHLSLPITARKADLLERAAATFADLFEGHAGPNIGLLIGGPSSPIQFGEKDGKRLLEEALSFAASRGGRLLVAASPRTPAEVAAHFAAHLPAPHLFFPFRPGTSNPYPALLARCETFIVTSDSVSMVADAALTGRELRLFDLPVKKARPLWEPSWPIAHWVGRRRNQRLTRGLEADWLDRWFEKEVRAARAQPVRYVPIIVQRLLREGHVARLGDPNPPRTDLVQLAAQELDMVAARIVALLAEKRATALRAQLAQGGGLAGRRFAGRPELGAPNFAALPSAT